MGEDNKAGCGCCGGGIFGSIGAVLAALLSWKVNHSIESPERYVLMIYWDSVDDHMVGFRQGPLFPQWRAIIGPFFAQPPQVEHFTLVGKSG